MGSPPRHVVIIPDRNRTWAEQCGYLTWQGHRIGYAALKKILPHVWDCGVTHFTFWALSRENLRKRDAIEIAYLKTILKEGIAELRSSPDFITQDIRFYSAGELWERHFSSDLSCLVDDLQQETSRRKGPAFTLLLAYDGKEEFLSMIDRIRREVPWPQPVEERHVQERLWTSHLPPIDLLIRTGERRKGWTHLSGNMLMWQMRDPEIYTTETMWPDFTLAEFKSAVAEFQKRERRQGV